MAIEFYRVREAYGCFSNFAPYGFTLDDKTWFTSEHYFQAQKFVGTKYEEEIRLLRHAKDAAAMGRDRALPLRSDWDQVKDEVMRKAVSAKFDQNENIQLVLLKTGTEIIIEKTIDDYYWGCGMDGSGKNKLGLILMEVRDRLKQKRKDCST